MPLKKSKGDPSMNHPNPYLNGLHYKGVYMGYPYPNFCLCAFFGSLYITDPN